MRYLKKRFWIVFALGLLFAFNSTGQVNTEKFRKFSDKEGFLFNAGFRFGYSGGNSEYLTVDGTARLDYNAKKNDVFLVANYDFKETSEAKVTNKGFVHLRGIHHFSDFFAGEAFIQQEFNEFLLLADRNIFGAGGRFKWIDYISPKDSVSGFKSYLGIGLMHENEIYEIGEKKDSTVILSPIRLTSYITLDYAITERINAWGVIYYQPAINSLHNFRTVMETGMEIWLIGRMYFTINLSYRYNNEPVGDVKNFDLVIKNGLRVAIP